MVVLRADREEDWLILHYVTPPTLSCCACAARLEMGKQRLLGKGFVRNETSVRVGEACVR